MEYSIFWQSQATVCDSFLSEVPVAITVGAGQDLHQGQQRPKSKR